MDRSASPGLRPGDEVGKEEIVGAVVALDRWINFPTAKHDRDQWLPRLKLIEAELNTQPGIRTEVLSWPVLSQQFGSR